MKQWSLCVPAVNCLLFTALASLSAATSFEPSSETSCGVRQTRTQLVFFCVPDEYGCRPGDVGTPSTLEYQKAEALGGFAATVEALGPLWDRPAARVLRTDLHDKRRAGGSHAKHRWQCTDSEYSHLENSSFGKGATHLCCVHIGPIGFSSNERCHFSISHRWSGVAF